MPTCKWVRQGFINTLSWRQRAKGLFTKPLYAISPFGLSIQRTGVVKTSFCGFSSANNFDKSIFLILSHKKAGYA